MTFSSRVAHVLQKHPCRVQCCVLLSLVVCVGLLVGGGLLQFNAANSFFIRDDIRTEYVQALEVADDFLQTALAGDADVPQQSDPATNFDLFLIFRAGGPTMATPELLNAMLDLNTEFVSLSTYDDVCLLRDGLCAPPISFMEARSPLVANATYEQLSENPSQADIDNLLTAFATDSDLSLQRNYVFPSTFDASNTNAKFMRSYFPMGLPLAGYTNRGDREEDQQEDFVDLIRPFHKRINVDEFKLPGGGEVVLFGAPIWSVALDEQVSQDTMWAAGAVVFVFLFMIFQVGSLFLATMGILQILLAFPFAFLLYFGLMQVSLFDSLHSLAVFVIIGVGADDIFVFHSAWEQFGGNPSDLKGRMTFAYSHASKAMFVTSFTTMSAFLATAVNPILPIATFGLWAASLILCNYILVLSMFGSILVIWQRYVRAREAACFRALCGCCSRKRAPAPVGDAASAPKDDGSAPAPANTNGASDGAGAGAGSGTGDDAFSKDPEAAGANKDAADGSSPPPQVYDRVLERFFDKTYFPFLLRYRYVVLGLFVVLFIVAFSLASQLEPLSTEEQFFPDDHYITRASDWSDLFRATDSDGAVNVGIANGLLGIDRSGTDRFDPDDLGRPKWDRSFKPFEPAAQEHLLTICDTLRNSSRVLTIDECWVEDFRDWLQGQAVAFPFVAAGPVPTGLTADEHQEYEFGQQLLRWTNATTGGAVALGNSYVGLVRGEPLGTAPNTTPEGVVQMWLSEIRIVLSLKMDTSRANSLPFYNDIQLLLDDLNANAPASANFAFQASQKWMWMETERALLRSALQGIAISAAVAFVVMVFATRNFYVAILSIVCIFGIMATVMAMVFVLGWQLGVTESISSVIVIGFSVDYVVHLATHFVESKYKDRRRRTHDSLVTMGISILGGAFSTGGASLFLFGAVIVFFTKMGIILLTTVVASLLWSCGGLASLLVVIGPQGDAGSIMPCVNKLMCWRKSDTGKSGKDVEMTTPSSRTQLT